MDIYDRLYEELAKRLPNQSDTELLKGLIEILRTDGKKGVIEELDKMINTLAGEV